MEHHEYYNSDIEEDEQRQHGVVSTISILEEDDGFSVTDSSTTSISLNPSTTAEDDREGIALLRQIFAEESIEELRRIHLQRLERGAAVFRSAERRYPNKSTIPSPTTTSTTPPRSGPSLDIQSNRTTADTKKNIVFPSHQLPDDFLRLPSSVAVLRSQRGDVENNTNGMKNETDLQRYTPCHRYESLAYLESKVMGQIEKRSSRNNHGDNGDARSPARNGTVSTNIRDRLLLSRPGAFVLTRAVFRDSHIGLGMTLSFVNDVIRVHSVAAAASASSGDQTKKNTSPHGKPTRRSSSSKFTVGPSMKAGILPGDIILGFNGNLLSMYKHRRHHSQHHNHRNINNNIKRDAKDEDMLMHVVNTIRNSPDPIVVHICRVPAKNTPIRSNHSDPVQFSGTSLLDETVLDSSNDDIDIQLDENDVNAIGGGGRRQQEHVSIWSTPSFFQNGEPQIHKLIQILSSRGLVPSQDEAMELSADIAMFNQRAWEMESFSSIRITDSHYSNRRRYGGGKNRMMNDTLIPLVGVRKGLSARIVNYFTEGPRTAYTIWVYDVESGQEWYAPLRYFEDFMDLRHAAINLIPRFGKLPFPARQSTTTSIFGSPRSNSTALMETRCWQLEKFLRVLCSVLYDDSNQLEPAIAEVAIHVQSFLGCGSIEFHPADGGCGSLPAGNNVDSSTRDQVESLKHVLKRSFQFYTYRIFLLKPLAYLVDDFVESMRRKSPSLKDLESIESQGVSTLQQLAMKDLGTLEKFLDFLQQTILEGCIGDFRSITMHETFFPLTERGCFHGKKGEIAWTALVRDAVREQVEVEAYVPLRSVVSRWLVNGWRHEDMEVHSKINELRKRPISYFSNVPVVQSGPQTWLSVSGILKENVERSTLPCAKLRAIVEAAREIARICAAENEARRRNPPKQQRQQQLDNESLTQLGADQFLPILIYCVIMATIERPCALCVLLRSLCDKVHRIGEVGYYLASFEASVVHVREFDLTERSEQMQSFVSVNLDAD